MTSRLTNKAKSCGDLTESVQQQRTDLTVRARISNAICLPQSVNISPSHRRTTNIAPFNQATDIRVKMYDLGGELKPFKEQQTVQEKQKLSFALSLFHRPVRQLPVPTPDQQAYYRCASLLLENAIFVEPSPNQARKIVSFQGKNNAPCTNSSQIAFQPKPMPKK